jgi:hypothetical protein
MNYEEMISIIYEGICQDYDEDFAKEMVPDTIGNGMSGDEELEVQFNSLDREERQSILKKVLAKY